MMRFSSVLGAVGLAALAAAPVAAQGKPAKGRPAAGATRTTASVTVIFRDTDRVVYRDYFRRHTIVATPLPPGITKNVLRGKPLPPGIAKRAVPRDLIVLGPRIGPDVTLIIAGDRVVALRNGLVIDVMIGVFN